MSAALFRAALFKIVQNWNPMFFHLPIKPTVAHLYNGLHDTRSKPLGHTAWFISDAVGEVIKAKLLGLPSLRRR